MIANNNETMTRTVARISKHSQTLLLVSTAGKKLHSLVHLLPPHFEENMEVRGKVSLATFTNVALQRSA
jgi:hypothetical protein